MAESVAPSGQRFDASSGSDSVPRPATPLWAGASASEKESDLGPDRPPTLVFAAGLAVWVLGLLVVLGRCSFSG